MAVGTIVTAAANSAARKPAYVLTIDFGEKGMKTSSAQLTENYAPDDLVGRQVAAVMNFPPLRVAGIRSEVLVLGAVDAERGVVLLRPDVEVSDGTSVA
ncbi:tRNA-binding protein [Planctomycetes bacterium Pan216]|uniref:tRNA-binding protein n=2 Tax=Kolteria novifilia TaxID=2527975 RepID=A0A518AZT5_9BACT|nr:tRNA-binding protein [Planctomycetes bacterium Pan216]